MINKANQQLDRQLVQRIADLEQDVRDIKSRQLFGSDNIPIVESPFGTAAVTMPAGSTGSVSLVFTYIDRHSFYLSEPGIVTYINNYGDPTYAWPYGSNLTGDLLKFDRDISYDFGRSSEPANGIKYYTLALANTGVSSKTIYVDAVLAYIQQATS